MKVGNSQSTDRHLLQTLKTFLKTEVESLKALPQGDSNLEAYFGNLIRVCSLTLDGMASAQKRQEGVREILETFEGDNLVSLPRVLWTDPERFVASSAQTLAPLRVLGWRQPGVMSLCQS